MRFLFLTILILTGHCIGQTYQLENFPDREIKHWSEGYESCDTYTHCDDSSGIFLIYFEPGQPISIPYSISDDAYYYLEYDSQDIWNSYMGMELDTDSTAFRLVVHSLDSLKRELEKQEGFRALIPLVPIKDHLIKNMQANGSNVGQENWEADCTINLAPFNVSQERIIERYQYLSPEYPGYVPRDPMMGYDQISYRCTNELVEQLQDDFWVYYIQTSYEVSLIHLQDHPQIDFERLTTNAFQVKSNFEAVAYDVLGKPVVLRSQEHSDNRTYTLEVTPGVYWVKIHSSSSSKESVVVQFVVD